MFFLHFGNINKACSSIGPGTVEIKVSRKNNPNKPRIINPIKTEHFFEMNSFQRELEAKVRALTLHQKVLSGCVTWP